MVGPHDENMTAEDTRKLAQAYREYRTGNPLIAHMLKERADDLDEQADEQENE